MRSNQVEEWNERCVVTPIAGFWTQRSAEPSRGCRRRSHSQEHLLVTTLPGTDNRVLADHELERMVAPEPIDAPLLDHGPLDFPVGFGLQLSIACLWRADSESFVNMTP